MSDAASLHLSDDRLIDLALGVVASAERGVDVQHMAGCTDCERRFREVCLESVIARGRGAALRRRATWRWVAAAAA
ncbi:MAG TPA: hypothetical protein VJS92_02250, partial [Candidatus Polarisedimenticolaceae bacterium]|nr:hypothetical protein [Candidatus Polarisedimenticolaceae bacterium]